MLTCCGCRSIRATWYPPLERSKILQPCRLAEVEQLYAQAVALEEACCATCVDVYFAVAAQTAAGKSRQTPARTRLHQQALRRLVVAGQEFGRLDPRSSLRINHGGQWLEIPVGHRGFVWSASDFEYLEVVGDYQTTAFENSYSCDGLGIPLVVARSDPGPQSYLPRRPLFAATLVMRSNGRVEHPGVSLELQDPLRVAHVDVAGKSVPISRDLSAPLALRVSQQPSNSALRNFLNPAAVEGEGGLYMIEPFQADKIPVVFIHGLLSDPFTWTQMVNELQADLSISSRYQLWVFEYPSGQAFLSTAARLRRVLQEIQAAFDDCRNPRLTQMVLVGHSMGGLISKLQIAASSDQLWRAIANRPFDETCIEPRLREELASAFFFEPAPQVSRVIFIGTPHEGSVYSRRLAGRVGALLIQESEARVEEHEQLLACNPGVFTDEVTRRIPTSIDLLDPDSRLLRSIRDLPIHDRVKTHSIIGEGGWTLGFGPSDGVVPVESARVVHAQSERYVRIRHGRLNKHSDSVEEVKRILHKHLDQPRTVASDLSWR